MASNPPARCCTIGVRHEGESQGSLTKVGGIESYVVYPENKKTDYAILILPDVIGHDFINAKLVADHFASNGYFTIIPDLFEGDPIPLNRPPGFELMKWLNEGGPSGGHTPKQIDPIVEAVIKSLKTEFGVQKLGSVGYCFGAKYVARYSASGKGIDVAAFAHPSFVEADELKNMVAPLSIVAAETDEIFSSAKRRESEDLLKEIKIPYQITLYSDTTHGFALRGDISNKFVKFAKEAAFLQHVQWFDEFLKDDRSSAA